MPGDTLHVYLDGVEVNETEGASLLVTDAPGEIRFLGLNAPADADSDHDGLPDDWEIQFLGNLASGGGDDGNRE